MRGPGKSFGRTILCICMSAILSVAPAQAQPEQRVIEASAGEDWHHQHSGMDMPARLGGDEFVIWFDGADRETAARKAEGLLKAAGSLAQYAVDETRKVGMSIGIACIGGQPHAPSENAESLVARADEAMYEIKHGGKNAYAFAKDPETSGDGRDGH